MSLKVWLPLDGDLRNLGTMGDYTFSLGSAGIDNEGKIGKCYKFTSLSSDGINLATGNIDNFFTNVVDNKSFSMCGWLKTSESYSPIIFLSYGIRLVGGANTLIGIDNNTNSITVNSNVTTNDGKWHHICGTYSSSTRQVKIYVDGINTGTGTLPGSDFVSRWRHGIFIGRNPNNSTASSTYFLVGSLNDIRIYDHALSSAEVHEIAQGLILHYKLDGNGFGNPNLLAKYVVPGQAAPTSTANGGRTTWLGDYKITIPATENADTYFRLFMTEQLISGTTYTISCKVSGLLDGSYYRFPLFAQSNTGMGLLYIDHNGLCSLTFTMNWTGTQTAATGANGETVYVNFLDDAARSLVSGQGPITLYDFKLEKGDTATTWCPADSELAIDRTIIRDSSGYNHNATAPSILATTSDTPRYSTATTFDGTNYGQIQSTIVESNHLSSEYTWAGWIYRDYTDESTRYLYNGIIRIYLNTNFSTRMQWNHSKSDGTSSTNTSDMGIIIPYREWTHLVWTFKDGYLKIYINGEYRNYSDRTSTGQFIKGYIGQMIGTNTSSVCQWIGNISDMRIYTTALLDNDIKLLYNMGMRVDNLGEVHGFELEEKDNNLLAGTLITSAYNNKVNPYNRYNSNGKMYFDTNSTSAGSNYISINPTNHTYYYDFDISLNAGNKFYIGFERYDADKTSRSNNATIYICDTRPTEDINHKHIFGTVDLSTDGVNPCAFIALRILNGWSGTTSGVVGTATIHSMSLREVSTIQNPKLYKNGILLTDEFKEYQKASFYKNGFVEATEFIEI